MSDPRYDLWLEYGKVVNLRVLRCVTAEMAKSWILEIDELTTNLIKQELKSEQMPEMAQIFGSGCDCYLKPVDSENPSEIAAWFVEEETDKWTWEPA